MAQKRIQLAKVQTKHINWTIVYDITRKEKPYALYAKAYSPIDGNIHKNLHCRKDEMSETLREIWDFARRNGI